VSADEKDNDPKVLLSYVAAALDSVQPIGQRVFERCLAGQVPCQARSCRGWDPRSGR
jgi:hypothetical protein